MIKKIYFNRHLPFPFVTFTMIATCLLVSFAAYYVSEFDAVLLALRPVTYWWQRFTTMFAHGGTYWGQAIQVHLTGNMTGMIVFSVLCERVLSQKKFLRFVTISLGVSLAVFYWFNMTGNGISSVVWSFIPLSVYIAFVLGTQYRKDIHMAPIVLVLLFSLWGVLIYPIVFGNNNLHNLGIVIGVAFTVLWKKDIDQRLEKIMKTQDIKAQGHFYKPKLLVIGIPIFVLSVMTLTHFGVIETVEVTNISEINQTSIEDIVRSGNQVALTFDRDMDMDIMSLQTHADVNVGLEVTFVDPRTLRFDFGNDIAKSAYIEILGDVESLDGIRYSVKLRFDNQ